MKETKNLINYVFILSLAVSVLLSTAASAQTVPSSAQSEMDRMQSGEESERDRRDKTRTKKSQAVTR